jgi:thiosulfate reductase cytochrome b subunit
MQGIYWALVLIVLMFVALFLLMEQRWRKRLEEMKTDSSSQTMWTLMQQQMEQLRGQMGDGLNKNISLLT